MRQAGISVCRGEFGGNGYGVISYFACGWRGGSPQGNHPQDGVGEAGIRGGRGRRERWRGIGEGGAAAAGCGDHGYPDAVYGRADADEADSGEISFDQGFDLFGVWRFWVCTAGDQAACDGIYFKTGECGGTVGDSHQGEGESGGGDQAAPGYWFPAGKLSGESADPAGAFFERSGTGRGGRERGGAEAQGVRHRYSGCLQMGGGGYPCGAGGCPDTCPAQGADPHFRAGTGGGFPAGLLPLCRF